MLLYQILAYAIHGKNIKKSYNKFKISTGNEECELLGKSYSVSDIQDHFEYNIKSIGKRLIILQ